MKTILNLTAAFAFATTGAIADTNTFQSIIGDAAKIQRDAQEISMQLKNKQPDFEAVKARSEAVSNDIKELRSDLEDFEAAHPVRT